MCFTKMFASKKTREGHVRERQEKKDKGLQVRGDFRLFQQVLFFTKDDLFYIFFLEFHGRFFATKARVEYADLFLTSTVDWCAGGAHACKVRGGKNRRRSKKVRTACTLVVV